MKKTIALVTGGFSGEAVISYKSATTIGNNLDPAKYNVYKIDINPAGWFYEGPDGKKTEINKNDFSLQIGDERITFDAVFVGMHGTPGEDGKLQGYFDTLKIPYTSCDAATSAITFNKRYTVAVAEMAGIHVANSIHLFRHSPVPASKILNELKLPVFVKPNNGGSSIGMSKVTNANDLEGAIAKAFEEDDQVLIEEMIQGREFTVGVFKTKGNIIVLPLTEVKAHDDKDFFDFEAKYQGKSSEVTPAVVEEAIADKIRDAAQKIYAVFNCRGVIRIDFIYNEETGKPFMLEVNSIPGQSEASIIPQQVRAMGWSLKEFYSKLVEECF
ncbi:MAG TPA: D-alanine--D-alanine ligase [Chitinophagaceae bacterium]|nr:D-alanine--D-alanine ligase [Chitinophagaceae bacterium]